jgi:DNA repair exonuclease SbcCD nuclease subunit
MRVLHLSDLHLRLSGPRAEECRRILDHIATRADETRPDVIVIAGDVFDRRSTPEERLYLAGFLSALADVAPVHVVPGNHDDAEDVALFGRLDDPGVHVHTRPIIIGHADLALAFLPWPPLGHLAAVMGPSASIADRRSGARAALLDILRGFRADPGLRPGAPSLLVGHLPVLGASMDGGQPVAGGDEIALSMDELLECGAAGVAMGHVHLRQQMTSGDRRPVWYAGAPFRGSFGEATGGKGGLVWEWNGGGWRVEPWDVPARRMLLVSCAWTDGHLDGDEVDPEEASEAEIRLRVEFPSDEREAARAAAAGVAETLREAGAHSVTVEDRPAIVSRTRCSEIAAARTTGEKLAAWAQATALEVPAGATGKLAVLEGEVQP